MMKAIKLYPQQQISILNIATVPSFKLLVRSVVTLGVCSGFTIPAAAQITTGGDGTVVNQTNGTFNITGGTPSTSGTNLFHSFGQFGLNTNQTANFVQPNANVQNILGRINGGLPSSIDGTLKVTGGNANLYLMNPAGIVFGKNASLDINGAFTATTARAIDFGNGNWFNALGANTYGNLNGNPIGLAFPGSTPGSIFSAATFDASDPTLRPVQSAQTARPGQSITLVGGTVISTGDIKTAGGNISIATVEGGKYVQIKADGSILRLDLPAAATNITPEAKNFTALLLPELLTATKPDLVATGVKIEGDVVKLVGDKTAIDAAIATGDTISKQDRPIVSGDIITKNLDTSSVGNNGGNIHLESNQAILSEKVNTSSISPAGAGGISLEKNGGNVVLNAQTKIKTGQINTTTANGGTYQTRFGSPLPTTTIRAHGGDVTLSTQTKPDGDIIVDSIDTSFSRNGDYSLRGGNLTVTSGGLFRIIKFIPNRDYIFSVSRIPLDTKASLESLFSVHTTPLGKVNITTGGTSFVTGAIDNASAIYGYGLSGRGPFPLKPGFTFGDKESGSQGLIIGSKSGNGIANIIYTNQGFKFLGGGGPTLSLTGFKIESNPVSTVVPPVPPVVITPVVPPTETKTEQTTDEQAAKQKSKQDCNPSSTAVAAGSTTDPTRSTDNASAPAANPCAIVTGTAGGTLQILNNKN